MIIGKSGQLASSFKKVDQDQKLNFIGQNDFDYADRASIVKVLNDIQPGLIINCAAYTLVDLAETETEKCQKLNFDFVTYLADWCLDRHCQLIHFSTDYVFDGTKVTEYIESDSTKPINWYGSTKAMGEKYLTDSMVQAVIFRISWVYSEFGNNFLKTMIRLGKEKESLNIVSDQLGSPCYAVNVAEVIYEWIFTNNLSGFKNGIYHLVPHQQFSWYDFANQIFTQYKLDHTDLKIKDLGRILTADYKTAACRPLNSRMNSSLAENEFGLYLEPFDASLKRALNALRS